MLALHISATKPVPHVIADGALASAAENDDAELVRALARADPDAYELLWRRFHPVVTAMVRRRLRDRGDAEDLVQEVFLAVFKSAPALRDPLALRAFVLTITSRMLNRKLKRRRTGLQLALVSQDQVDGLVGLYADTTAKHAVAGLRKLMSRLRLRERETFMLHFVAGLDATDVAQRLGVSIPTARRSLSRACKYVRLWASRDPFLFDYLRPRFQEPLLVERLH